MTKHAQQHKSAHFFLLPPAPPPCTHFHLLLHEESCCFLMCFSTCNQTDLPLLLEGLGLVVAIACCANILHLHAQILGLVRCAFIRGMLALLHKHTHTQTHTHTHTHTAYYICTNLNICDTCKPIHIPQTPLTQTRPSWSHLIAASSLASAASTAERSPF